MSWRSGYFNSEELTGGDYIFIMLIIAGLVMVARYIHGQYHKENRKLPPLEGENIKPKPSVKDLYPKGD